MPAYPSIHFRAGGVPSLAARLPSEDHGAATATAMRDLNRYYAILKASLPTLSEGEWGFLVDILNGTFLDETAARYLWAEAEDALRENPGLPEKWGIDGAALVARLRETTFAEQMAIVDAVDRFWLPGYHVASIHDRLVEIGVIPA